MIIVVFHTLCVLITNTCIVLPCRGDSCILQNGSLVATLWLDNQVVRTLSTNCQPTETAEVLRHQQDGSRTKVPCPVAIAAYNRFMGGVDRNDQTRQYYHVQLKGRKYYKYIFWFTFEASIANAYILFTRYCIATDRDPRIKSLLDFRLQLAKELIGEYKSRRRPGRKAAAVPKVLPLCHFPRKFKRPTKKGVSPCWYCAEKRYPARRRETVWYCSECQLHLCLSGLDDGSNCFLLHHENML